MDYITDSLYLDKHSTFSPNPTLSIPLIDNTTPIRGVSVPTFVRPKIATHVSKDTGLVVEDAIDAARFEAEGLLSETSVTNICLHNRDMSNVLWIKTGITAVRNAVGATGDSGTASTVTATAGNGTIFQPLVAGSSERTYSADIRRKTGTGTIEMTDDGGVTYTDITSLINSVTYTRIQFTNAQANPSIGFRVVTSGDEIEVDYNQIEGFEVAQSRKETGSGTASQGADVLNYVLQAGEFSETVGSITFDAHLNVNANGNQGLVNISDGSANEQFLIYKAADVLRVNAKVGGAFTALTLSVSPWADGQTKSIKITYDASGSVKTFEDGVLTDTKTLTLGMPTGLNKLEIGQFTSGSQVNGHIKNLKFYDTII